MLQHYIEHLITAIRRNEKMQKNAQLKGGKWTKSCFELASNIISNELDQLLSASEKLQSGVTISAKTLSNMFRGEYRLSYPLDPRTLNTLTKIARFLGYASWEQFTDEVDISRQQQAASADPVQAAEYALREALAEEYRLYCMLPTIEAARLLKYYIPDGPAFNRLMDNLLHFQSKGYHISNPYNPSTHEIFELDVLQHSEEQVRFRTREYWLLCWWDDRPNRYIRRHKALEEHFYQLEYSGEGWKVRSNATLADVTEAEEWSPEAHIPG